MSEQTAGPERRYRLLRVSLDRFGCEPRALDDKQQKQAERIVARQLEIEEAVLRSPEAIGVVIPESQVRHAWKSIGERYEDEAALSMALEHQGLDVEGVSNLLARELKVEAVLERISTGAPEISDTDVSLYYFSHIEQFDRPETRRARHILLTINPEFPENTREASRTRIQAIAHRLGNKPERFAEQAMKHSECPTSLQGGTLGDVKRGTLYPQLEDCLFGLKEGEISPTVESPMGFHLMLCEAITPSGRMPLEEVLPRLRDWLQSRQRQARQRQWLETLLEKSAPLEELAHG
ncbi:nitrogen fixation protein NifM [Stutzerimonas tarimensis]|uniref:peptidylprolyl isomerase n=1 Tax=Stutzerimonas tarimensis TaxID=1507735 RepID=A0ABV7T781_9GAMM